MIIYHIDNKIYIYQKHPDKVNPPHDKTKIKYITSIIINPNNIFIFQFFHVI